MHTPLFPAVTNSIGQPAIKWTSCCGRASLIITDREATQVAAANECSGRNHYLARLLREPHIAEQFETMTHDQMSEVIIEYDGEEPDNETFQERLLWLACFDIEEIRAAEAEMKALGR